MRRIILATVLVLVLTGSAWAVPWKTVGEADGIFGGMFLQLTVPELSFNYIEGFISGGQHFSLASPENGIDFDGIGNFSTPGWQSERPNGRYVRAWGPSETFLRWDAAFVGDMEPWGDPVPVDIFWMFYNTPDGTYDPTGQLSLLTYFARFMYGNWEVYSASQQPFFGAMPNHPIPLEDMHQLPTGEYFDWLRYQPEVVAEPVPEPGTAILMGAGLVGLVFFRRRQLLNKV